MKVELEDYRPLGTEILLKPNVKTHSEGGVLLGQEKVDRWFEVVKLGNMVDKILKPGDHVIFDMAMAPQMNLTFGGELYIQVNMHSIKGMVPVNTEMFIDNITST